MANLLSNSVKYTNPGGEIWYSIRLIPCNRPEHARLVSTVRDTYRGMSREFLDRIFDS